MKTFLALIVAANLANAAVAGETVVLGDVSIHYEERGEGSPLLLLHGALQHCGSWGPLLDTFAESYRVIAPDTRGHGKSSFVDTAMTYSLLAQDVVALLDHLGLERVDIVGLSDGANTGLHVTLAEPARVGRLVFIGGNIFAGPEAVDADYIARFEAMDLDAVAGQVSMMFPESPNPDLAGAFVRRMHTMLLNEPRLTPADLAEVAAPVLVVRGDRDFIKMAHAQLIYESLPDASLFVLPSTSHHIPTERPELLGRVALDFLHHDSP